MATVARTVAAWLEAHEEWRAELEKLRGVLLAAGLEEAVKWGSPCYMHGGENVVGLVAFRNWVALWFYQGASLADPDRVLVNAQEGRTKALRQWRFTGVEPIPVRRVAAYVREAKALAGRGRAVATKASNAVVVPGELEGAFAAAPAVRAAFAALSPGPRGEDRTHDPGRRRAQ